MANSEDTGSLTPQGQGNVAVPDDIATAAVAEMRDLMNAYPEGGQ